MVGPRFPVVDGRIRALRGPADQNPIHPAETLRFRVLVSEATLEALLLESITVLGLMEVRIQVTRDHDRHILRVLSSVGKRLFHLPHASRHGTALEVEIINNNQAVQRLDFHNLGHPPS